MPLSEQSSLEDSLARILGAPATPAATTPPPPAASLMDYSSPMSKPGSTSVALGAVQPVTAEPPPTAITTTPITTTTPEVATTAPVTGEVAEAVQPELTKSYNDYYTGNLEAQEKSYMRGDSTDAGVGSTWAGENPYQYRNEYNQYVLDNDKALADYYKGQGITDLTYNEYWGGNQEALEASFRKGSATDAGVNQWSAEENPYRFRNEYNAYIAGAPAAEGTVAAPVKAPVNPGPKAPWQQSQQYWKDLAAYNATGAK